MLKKRLNLRIKKHTHKKIITPNRNIRKSSAIAEYLTSLKRRKHDYRHKMRVNKDTGHVSAMKVQPWRMAYKAASYVAIVAILTVTILGTFFAFDLHFGNEVIVNGKSVGLISDSEKFDVLLKDVKNLAQAATNGEAAQMDVTLIPRIVQEKDVTPEFTLRQNMLSGVDQMVEAYAVYVNDSLICGTIAEEDAFEALDAVRNQYNKGSLLQVEFLDQVAVRKEFVPVIQVLSSAGVVSALNGKSQHREIYTAEIPEEISNVAERFGMTLAQIQDINKGVPDVIDVGDKVNIVKTQSVIRVQTQAVEKYNREIDYEIATSNDNTLAKGQTAIVKKGVAGLAQVVATVIRVNGEEQERIPISETIIRVAQAETIKIGTKEGGTTVASSGGTFIRPASGTITSRFGTRWGGEQHTGIDIGATYGASIRAAVGGKVILAGWNGNYGLSVRVDSGNGLVEIYGHASEILVKEGQMVQKGDVIARVGNTGRSTGTHLHFEIRKNGTPVDPTAYVKDL
ncbi:metalloendopeptidase [Clostridia bacterium]|nr:metalloendopeptidase [Clostridia bacterium]